MSSTSRNLFAICLLVVSLSPELQAQSYSTGRYETRSTQLATNRDSSSNDLPHRVRTQAESTERFVEEANHIIVTYLLPAVITVVFAYLILLNTVLIRRANSIGGAIRRTVGALLPFVAFIFLATAGNEASEEIARYLSSLPSYTRVISGAVIAALLMESGKHLGAADEDALAAVYALMLSSIMAFCAWAFIGRFLAGVSFAIVAFVITAGIHVMFRGLPSWFMRILGDSPTS